MRSGWLACALYQANTSEWQGGSILGNIFAHFIPVIRHRRVNCSPRCMLPRHWFAKNAISVSSSNLAADRQLFPSSAGFLTEISGSLQVSSANPSYSYDNNRRPLLVNTVTRQEAGISIDKEKEHLIIIFLYLFGKPSEFPFHSWTS